jgi:hypothetical protein
MIKVIFCPEGHHVADDHTLAYVDSVFWEYDFGGRMDIEVKVGNELILDGFVLRLMEKKFPANEIEFYDNDVKLEYDECRGLIVTDPKKQTIGAHARITAQIFKLGLSNMRAKQLESEE